MSDPIVEPYLFFDGNCAEAVAFYGEAVGAEVQMMMRFSECPDPLPPDMQVNGDRIMHASFKIGQSVIMASDGCGDSPKPAGFSLSITVDDEAAADRAFDALAAGGKVDMPLSKTFWSPRFGMLTDRFGIQWMINVQAEKPC